MLSMQTLPSSSLPRQCICVCCLVELIGLAVFPAKQVAVLVPSGCIYVAVCPGWTEMTASPLCPERDLGWAMLSLHSLWSHIGLLGQLLIVCVCVRDR